MYQEDYPSLLYATEIGRRITYDPSTIMELAQEFSQNIAFAVDEVSCCTLAANSLKCTKGVLWL